MPDLPSLPATPGVSWFSLYLPVSQLIKTNLLVITNLSNLPVSLPLSPVFFAIHLVSCIAPNCSYRKTWTESSIIRYRFWIRFLFTSDWKFRCDSEIISKMSSKNAHKDSSKVHEEISSDKNCDKMPSSLNKRKYSGSFKYKVTFKDFWKSQYPVKAVPNDKQKFHYLPHGKNLSCHHQGLKDVQDRCSKDIHKGNLQSWKNQPQINFSFTKDNTQEKNKCWMKKSLQQNF